MNTICLSYLPILSINVQLYKHIWHSLLIRLFIRCLLVSSSLQTVYPSDPLSPPSRLYWLRSSKNSALVSHTYYKCSRFRSKLSLKWVFHVYLFFYSTLCRPSIPFMLPLQWDIFSGNLSMLKEGCFSYKFQSLQMPTDAILLGIIQNEKILKMTRGKETWYRLLEMCWFEYFNRNKPKLIF